MAWGVRLMLVALLSMLFGCDTGGPYARKQGVWRFGKETLDVPAGEQVTSLNARFAKSATRVWYRSTPIPGADAASFEAIDEHYARDTAHAWYGETYRDGRDYYTTQRVRLRQLDQAIPGSLKVLAGGYAVDGAHAFYEGLAFPVADAGSFEPLDDGFAHDREHGYFRRVAIAGSEGAGFSVIGQHFARDGHSVFWADPDGPAPVATRLAGAEPTSFQALSYGYAKDARRAYYQSKALTDDLASFQALDYGYAKSDKAVYFAGESIPGADAASFTILSPVTETASAQDKRGLFNDGLRVSAPAASEP